MTNREFIEKLLRKPIFVLQIFLENTTRSIFKESYKCIISLEVFCAEEFEHKITVKLFIVRDQSGAYRHFGNQNNSFLLVNGQICISAFPG